MIAEAMFENSLQPGAFERVRARFISHLGLESGEEDVGELREIAVGALRAVLPENEVGRESKHDENHCEDARIPERQPDADGFKHGSSSQTGRAWDASCVLCLTI